MVTALQAPVALSEVRLSPASNAYVTDLSWNPAVFNMLTCCISDRTLSVYTFNPNGSFEIKSLPKESNSLYEIVIFILFKFYASSISISFTVNFLDVFVGVLKANNLSLVTIMVT